MDRSVHSRLRVILALALVGLLAPVTGCVESAPSVDSLVATYAAHKSAFDRAARATLGGPEIVLDLDSYTVRPRDLSQSTVATLTSAMLEIGARRVEFADGELGVTLGSSGMASSGFEWGYAYVPGEPPAPVVSLDVARSASAPELWYYPLGGKWYATGRRW